jgi:hypothetical protein
MIVYWYSCIAYIKSKQDFDNLLYIVLGASIFYFVEMLSATFLLSHFSFLHYSIDSCLSFHSIFLNDSAACPFVVCIAGLTAIYFNFVRKNTLFLIVTISIVSVIVYNANRTDLCAYILSCIFLYVLQKRYIKSVSMSILLVCFSCLMFVSIPKIKTKFLKPAIKKEWFSSAKLLDVTTNKKSCFLSFNSLQSRIGMSIRTMQVWLHYACPLGFGYMQTQYYMANPQIPFYQDNSYIFQKFPEIWVGYKRTTYDEVIADPQWGLLSYFSYYGIPFLMLCIYVLITGFKKLRFACKNYHEQLKSDPQLALVLACGLFYFLYLQTLAAPLIFQICVMLLHLFCTKIRNSTAYRAES